MNPLDNRRALQIAIAVAGLVPVGGGLAGVLLGPAMAGQGAAAVSLDSHFRYLSGLLLGLGLVFWSLISTIERRGDLVRALTLMVVLGGLGRALSLVERGEPASLVMRLAIVMELIVTPLLCLWQHRVETQAKHPAARDLPLFSAPSQLS